MDKLKYSQDLIAEMNRYYEARAPWHDMYMSYKSPDKMKHLMKPIINKIDNLIKDKIVMELACGTGNWTQILAEKANHVTATDFSKTALQIAENKLTGYNNIILEESDVYNLGNKNQQYELLFAADWWSHIPYEILPEFIKSCMARLKPSPDNS